MKLCGRRTLACCVYDCLGDLKKRTTCPVQRVNADALHHSVLREIERAARHHTVIHRIIAQSGGWSVAPEDQKSLRGQLTKRKQYIEMQIGNYIRAIGDGRFSSALFAALEKFEAEKKTLSEELDTVENEIENTTVSMPP